MLPTYALLCAIRSVTSMSKKRRASKRFKEESELGSNLRTSVGKRVEVAAMFKALLDGKSLSQFAYSLGWRPPAVFQGDLDGLASLWLDKRWRDQEEADSNNQQWRTSDGE